MTVFKTFLKVLNKCKMPVILFTIILIIFGSFSMESSNNSTNFVAAKPSILIVNNDENIGITKCLIDYIKKNSEIKDIKNTDDDINDALFYREVNYVIYIPKDYRKNFLGNKNPEIKVKTVEDYGGMFSEMILERFIKLANVYAMEFDTEEEIINNINETLSIETKVEVTSKLDEDGINKLVYFYNFSNYSLLAGGIYVVCLILSSFKSENIRKRTFVSSMNYKEFNRKLLLSNSLFMIALWLFYTILSIIILKDIMFTTQGLICCINSFIFSMCCLTIAFLIGNIITNKNAINGIINVVALGSSFLCGCFVPMEWLPSAIVKFAHILPLYWYIKTNELLKDIEVFNVETIKPIIFNMFMLVIFMIIFTVAANIISKKKQRV